MAAGSRSTTSHRHNLHLAQRSGSNHLSTRTTFHALVVPRIYLFNGLLRGVDPLEVSVSDVFNFLFSIHHLHKNNTKDRTEVKGLNCAFS